jgi:hypothetical protein
MTGRGRRGLMLVGLTWIWLLGCGRARADPPKVGVHLKLTAGLGFLFDGAGDLKGFRENARSFAAEWGLDVFQESSFNWPGRSSLPDFRAELLLTFGRHLGVGFGTGRASLSNGGDFSLLFDYYDSRWFAVSLKEESTFRHWFELTVVPLELAGYGFLPLGRLTLYAFGGPGLYLGTLRHNLETQRLYRRDIYLFEPNGHSALETQSFEQGSEKATTSGLGLRGGFGVRVCLTPRLSVGFESALRWAGLGDWQGTYSSGFESSSRTYDDLNGWSPSLVDRWTEEGSGSLWLTEIKDDRFGGVPGLRILENPEAAESEVVREASFNLNGLSLLFTLTFHF